MRPETKILAIAMLLVAPPKVFAGAAQLSSPKAAPPVELAHNVIVPKAANQRVVLMASNGTRASFVARGAEAVGASVEGGSTVFKGGLRIGEQFFDVSLTPVAGGVEDFVLFPNRPSRESISYDLDIGTTAGLRLVGNSLELLDAHGTPQLRVRPPYLIDASGTIQTARLGVGGCAYDASPLPPWGRRVVAPESTCCEVVVDWGGAIGASIEYPAVLDPAWVSGGSMVQPRNAHAAVTLADGRVLVAGGFISMFSANYSNLAEIFDPVTTTWASTAPMGRRRARIQAVVFTSGPQAGKALWAAGDDLAQPTAEVYDPNTGLWSPTSPMFVTRDGPVTALLGDGRAIVAGGCSAISANTCVTVETSAEIYDSVTDAWTLPANTMTAPRAHHSVTTLGNGKTIVAGGCTAFGANFACNSTTTSADLFDPITNSFTPVAPLLFGHQNHSAVALPGGEALIIGGTDNGALTKDTEVFSPATGAWTKKGDLVYEHDEAPAVALSSGLVLIAGSWGTSFSQAEITSTAELYDAATGVWTAAPSMATSHGDHTTSAISGGRALVAGGFQGGPNLTGTESGVGEIFDLSINCGDGIVSGNEECDDNNTTSGDGCSATCHLEICGNGTVDTGEQCDDGNTIGGDGCSAACLFEVCGDGVLDVGEVCDDGNTTSGDGCRSDCLSLETCGNGTIDAAKGELCDDGNTVAGDGCGPTCQLEVCGNGILDTGEACDDGNTVGGDGCSADCSALEACGDGNLDPGEQCDDGNKMGADGCSATCLLEVCGNGILDPGEQCDDHNVASGDGCSPACKLEGPASCGNAVIDPGEQCDDGSGNGDTPNACRTSCLHARCGDGITDSGEDCDLGAMNGDTGATCTAGCKSAGTTSGTSACGCELADANGSPLTPMVVALLVLGLTRVRQRGSAALCCSIARRGTHEP